MDVFVELVSQKNTIKVFRQFLYTCNSRLSSQEIQNGTGILYDNIIQELKNVIGTRQSIDRLDRVRVILIICNLVEAMYDVLHRHYFHLLIIIYRKIMILWNEIKSSETPVLEVEHCRKSVFKVILLFRSLWISLPRFLFTMPTDISITILEEEIEQIMNTPGCVNIIFGKTIIPGWIDIPIVEWIHLQRRKKKSDKWSLLLKDIFRTKSIPSEICCLIASFIPIERICMKTHEMLLDSVCQNYIPGTIQTNQNETCIYLPTII
jgi:hypothetical protein